MCVGVLDELQGAVLSPHGKLLEDEFLGALRELPSLFLRLLRVVWQYKHRAL